MVMERIRGVTISDMATLRAIGTNIRMLARTVKIFFIVGVPPQLLSRRQAPGNIFVLVDDPARPRYAAVDFGIVGTLDLRDMHYLAENFLAVFDRNYRRRVAELHVESGCSPMNGRIDELESAIRTGVEPIFNRPLKDISFGTILLRLFDIRDASNMRIQPQLILLAEDAAQHRGTRSRPLPGTRHLADRRAHPARVDARTAQPAHPAASSPRASAGAGGGGPRTRRC
jgi:ubiquinone biosynthesis protein